MICPHCNETIHEMDYCCSTSGWESGTFYLSPHNNEAEWDYNEGETSECHDWEYMCPKCNKKITDDDGAAKEMLLVSNVESKKQNEQKQMIERAKEFEL